MANTKDQFNMVGTEASAVASFIIISSIQKETAGTQVAAIANLLLLTCDRYKLDVRDVLDLTRRRLRDAFSEGRGEHIRALKTYVNEEFK
jgi:hypothetical protein